MAVFYCACLKGFSIFGVGRGVGIVFLVVSLFLFVFVLFVQLFSMIFCGVCLLSFFGFLWR